MQVCRPFPQIEPEIREKEAYRSLRSVVTVTKCENIGPMRYQRSQVYDPPVGTFFIHKKNSSKKWLQNKSLRTKTFVKAKRCRMTCFKFKEGQIQGSPWHQVMC